MTLNATNIVRNNNNKEKQKKQVNQNKIQQM